MNSPNYTESTKILNKALDAIASAKHDLKGGFILAATNRAYYACFYCMTALLLTENIHAKTHQGTRAKFSELFIKTNIFSDTVANTIRRAFELRHEADYDFDSNITEAEAEELILKASEIYQLSKSYIEELD